MDLCVTNHTGRQARVPRSHAEWTDLVLLKMSNREDKQNMKEGPGGRGGGEIFPPREHTSQILSLLLAQEINSSSKANTLKYNWASFKNAR